jgi:Dcp2, box A domain
MDKPKKSATYNNNSSNNNTASKTMEGNKKLSAEYYNSITTFTSMLGTPQNLLHPIQPSSSGGGGVKIPKDLLDDLASRFIINIPDHERIDMIRVCFQIELAHWFYLDFMLPTNNENVKKLPSCGIKQFTWQIFNVM